MIDFDKEFSDFVGSSSGNMVKDIYDTIPVFTPQQIQIIDALYFLVGRWELNSIESFLSSYIKNMQRNKSLGIMKNATFSKFLKAYNLEELVRGIKYSAQRVDE